MSDLQTLDPRGLIKDSYAIDGISEPECRSIFLDWALGVPSDVEPRTYIAEALSRYAGDSDHPMTRVLTEGLEKADAPKRRGGARARR